MEILLAAFLPIALLFFGLALIYGRSTAPGPVIRLVISISMRTLRLLWQDRPQRRGAGRPKRPPHRYRR